MQKKRLNKKDTVITWDEHWGKQKTVERLDEINTSYKEVVDYLLSVTDKNSKCIEIGCGSGVYSLEMMKEGRDCVASDISEKALELTEIKGKKFFGLKKVPTKIVDIYDICYKDNTFDLVFSDGVIEHLNIPRVIKEMKRVVKKGGYLITKVPSGNWLYRVVYNLTSPIEARPYEVWYKPNKWRELFKDAGFSDVKVEMCGSVVEGVLNRVIKNKGLKNAVPKIGKIYYLIKCKKN
jgi:ubiquinone/menaquinone biosynthesis C-methylase UbiE